MNHSDLQSSFLIIQVIVFLSAGCTSDPKILTEDRDRLFNLEWKFTRDSVAGNPEQPFFNDAGWQVIDLPHDWSIADLPGDDGGDQIGPFSKRSPGATSTGYVLGGTGWYRKHFTLSKHDAGKTVILRFDGVYMEAEVWVNGKSAGQHTYGYTPFWFDITNMLNPAGKENVIAVKVNNPGRNSRWYSGSGIYRNVYLTLVEPMHIATWGVYVTSPVVTSDSADIDLSITIRNFSEKEVSGKCRIRITGPDGKDAGTTEVPAPIRGREEKRLNISTRISKPDLWSPASPKLYQAEVSLYNGDKLTDRFIQPFGIRTYRVSPENGLLINGEPLEMKGACLHHDNGLLGSAAIERAEERRVEIMKANGFNAIRTSHNPPSEAFLNACDRLGMIVIDETFDMWERPKNPQDYHRHFRECWKKDVEAMILRDRNHPSILFWSIGNEINERADTSGLRIASSMISYIRELDTTRIFTNAVCEFWDYPGRPWETTAPAFELLDVGGYNYQWKHYEPDHIKYPDRIMMGTESVAMDAFENWQHVLKNPYVIGDFVWTGMDYLGETGIGHSQYLTRDQNDGFAMTWPWFNAWCGDIDITGGKKPQMYYRDVIWGNSLLELNVHGPLPEGKTEKTSYWGWPDEYPSWNWKGNEDKPLQVTVYSGGTSVRLELNGRVIGEKVTSVATKLKASFEVPYEPGELRAVALKDGKEIAVKTFKTTGEPAGIRLTEDRNPIRADRNDLSYITIEVVDEFGQVVTDAAIPINLTLCGNGELAGSGNASPDDMESLGNMVIRTYRGKALAIVRPNAKKGEIILKAESGRLSKGIVNVSVN
jgi:beta-galactosidase